MNKIDKLIAELCPNGVEYKPLGEVVTSLPGLKGKRKPTLRMAMPDLLVTKTSFPMRQLNYCKTIL